MSLSRVAVPDRRGEVRIHSVLPGAASASVAWPSVLQSEQDGSAVRVTGAELRRHVAGCGYPAYPRARSQSRSPGGTEQETPAQQTNVLTIYILYGKVSFAHDIEP